MFVSTASIRAASELKPACKVLNPPSTAANVSVTLIIATACAAAWSACAASAAACSACAASAAASASVTLAFTAAWAANWVVTWAEKRAKAEGGDGGEGGVGGGGGLDGGEGGDGGDLGGGGLGLGGGGLGFGGGDAFGATAPTPPTSSSAHKSTLSITRGAMRCARHVSNCPCNSSARRRTFTDTLQPRERPAERSLSASLQDRRGTGPSTSPPPAQLATALLRRSTSAPPVHRRRTTRLDRAVQRATLPGKPQASRKRELGGARAQRSPAARLCPAVPHLDAGSICTAQKTTWRSVRQFRLRC